MAGTVLQTLLVRLWLKARCPVVSHAAAFVPPQHALRTAHETKNRTSVPPYQVLPERYAHDDPALTDGLTELQGVAPCRAPTPVELKL